MNSRGDILGIHSGIGAFTAVYTYDSWGNVLSVKDENGNAITDPNHIGNLNPFRYRGYYYDAETGMYYLMSRYYDPQVKRFINADGMVSTGQGLLGYNMFAYANNNPVNMSDPTGNTPSYDTWYNQVRASGASVVDAHIKAHGSLRNSYDAQFNITASSSSGKSSSGGSTYNYTYKSEKKLNTKDKEITLKTSVKYSISDQVIRIDAKEIDKIPIWEEKNVARDMLSKYEQIYSVPMPNRTVDGLVWEMRFHAAGYKLTFENVSNLETADMGTYANDSNAQFWDCTSWMF